MVIFLSKKIKCSILLLAVFILTGCAEDKSGPKKLGYEIVESIKNRNLKAYLEKFITFEEKKFLIYRSTLTSEQIREQLSYIVDGENENIRRIDDREMNFNDICSHGNWSGAKINKIFLGHKYEDNGHVEYENIVIEFKKDILPDLQIDGVVQVRDYWKIKDDEALSFRSRI